MGLCTSAFHLSVTILSVLVCVCVCLMELHIRTICFLLPTSMSKGEWAEIRTSLLAHYHRGCVWGCLHVFSKCDTLYVLLSRAADLVNLSKKPMCGLCRFILWRNLKKLYGNRNDGFELKCFQLLLFLE